MMQKMPDPSPWIPEEDKIVLAHLGKFAEEMGECIAVASRCIIQGLDGNHPITGKSNGDWITEEMADVIAGIMLMKQLLEVDELKFGQRVLMKIDHLKRWHKLIEAANV